MSSLTARITNLERAAKAQRLEPDDTIDWPTRQCAKLLLDLRPGVEHVERDCEDDETWTMIRHLRAGAAGRHDEARELRELEEASETWPPHKMLTAEWFPQRRAESERQDAAIDRAIAAANARVTSS